MESWNQRPLKVTVIYQQYSATDFTFEDEEYLVVSEKDILAIIK